MRRWLALLANNPDARDDLLEQLAELTQQALWEEHRGSDPVEKQNAHGKVEAYTELQRIVRLEEKEKMARERFLSTRRLAR